MLPSTLPRLGSSPGVGGLSGISISLACAGEGCPGGGAATAAQVDRAAKINVHRFMVNS
jgi:hypothetical protein